MALGKRKSKQQELFIATNQIPKTPLTLFIPSSIRFLMSADLMLMLKSCAPRLQEFWQARHCTRNLFPNDFHWLLLKASTVSEVSHGDVTTACACVNFSVSVSQKKLLFTHR
jgi:hypothetical protein